MVKSCPPVEESELTNSNNDVSSQKIKRIVNDAGHGSDNISKSSKSTNYGSDRMNMRTFSEDTDDTRGTTFMRRE